MGLLGGKINIGAMAADAMKKLDDSSLTMQEKAVGVIDFMERLGITPSSVTRRIVTFIQIGFIILCYLVAMVVYRNDPEYAKFIKSVPIEYGTNTIIQVINAFFYGGYYLSKNVSPAMKMRLDEKKQKMEHQRKEEDLKLRKDEADANIEMKRKQDRISYRNRKRSRS